MEGEGEGILLGPAVGASDFALLAAARTRRSERSAVCSRILLFLPAVMGATALKRIEIMVMVVIFMMKMKFLFWITYATSEALLHAVATKHHTHVQENVLYVSGCQSDIDASDLIGSFVCVRDIFCMCKRFFV